MKKYFFQVNEFRAVQRDILKLIKKIYLVISTESGTCNSVSFIIFSQTWARSLQDMLNDQH